MFNHIRQVAPHFQLAGAVTAAGSDSGASMCCVQLRRWENQRTLSSLEIISAFVNVRLK